MATALPLIQTPRQAFATVVGGQDIRVTLWYQPRDKSWYASIEFPVGAPLISGRRVVLDGPLIGARPSSFAGDIFCRALSADVGEPGPEPWGATHQLVYEPQ